jgi:hypothetical protein
MAIDDSIATVTPAESRLDIDRIEYRLKDGPDRLDVYYNMVPVTVDGVPCGDPVRKHVRLDLTADVKADVIGGINVADALAVLRKLAKRTIKDHEQP